jgi:hypothetical protein
VRASGWSALAAWVALGIGLANLWYSVIRVWWRSRKASPAAQLDLLHFPTKSAWQEEVRVVVTNHGPAVMRKTEVQVFDEDGNSLAKSEPDVTALWPKMPIEYLHVGQSLYLTLNRSLATRDARGTLIRWHDNRKAEQSRWVGLSYNRVVFGSACCGAASTAECTAIRLSRPSAVPVVCPPGTRTRTTAPSWATCGRSTPLGQRSARVTPAIVSDLISQ